MLVISRKKGESIIIGDNIEVCVIDIQGDKVRLGFTADKDINILRKELIEAENFNKEASNKIDKDKIQKLGKLIKKK